MRGWRSRIFSWLLRRFVAVLGTSAGLVATSTIALLLVVAGALWNHCGGPDIVDAICRDAGYGKCGDGGELGAQLDPSGTGYYVGTNGIGSGAAQPGNNGQLAAYCEAGSPCAIGSYPTANAYGGLGLLSLPNMEVCIIPDAGAGAVAGALVCTSVVGGNTTDGGTNAISSHQIQSGTTRYLSVEVTGHTTCASSDAGAWTDSQVTTFNVLIAVQGNGAGAVMVPANPTPSIGPLYNGNGSAYGTPTITLDATAPATYSVNVIGLGDAGSGCSIDWQVGSTAWITP